MQLVRKTRKNNPFKVVEMKASDFLDLEKTTKQLVNRKKAFDGSPVKWLQIQSISLTKQDPQIMKFKYVCEDELQWSHVDLRRGREKARRTAVTTLVASEHKPQIKKEKFQDLQSLKDFIPPIFHAFYDSLSSEDNTNNERDILPDEELYISEEDDFENWWKCSS